MYRRASHTLQFNPVITPYPPLPNILHSIIPYTAHHSIPSALFSTPRSSLYSFLYPSPCAIPRPFTSPPIHPPPFPPLPSPAIPPILKVIRSEGLRLPYHPLTTILSLVSTLVSTLFFILSLALPHSPPSPPLISSSFRLLRVFP